jgi:hypothetical protein
MSQPIWLQCGKVTDRHYLCCTFDLRFARALVFSMHRGVTRALLRPAIALVAVYALLLNALLSAAVPFHPAASGEPIICLHDDGAPDQPAGPSSAHDESCCVAMCGMASTALPPSDYSRVPFLHVSTFSRIGWPVGSVELAPPPNGQASPRGPPSLV